MLRVIFIMSVVLVMSFGCSEWTEMEDSGETMNPQETVVPETLVLSASDGVLSASDGDQPPIDAEDDIAEAPSPEPKKRRKVGKGDLTKPLDDRVQAVLPAKIKRNQDGEPTVLHLKGYGVSPSDLAEIATYTKLTELQIGSNDLGDDDLHYFSHLDELRLLGIRRSPRITGSTFDQLAPLPALEELYVGECRLQPEFLKALSASKSLRLLGLRSHAIDQSWIDALCTITTLEEIHLNNNDITPAQIESLEQCLPEVLVETHQPRQAQPPK